MRGPEIAAVVTTLVTELAKGHRDCLGRGIHMLVTGDARGARQVTVTLAVWARRGMVPRPGQEFHQLEVFEFDEAIGKHVRVPTENLPAYSRTVMQMGVYAANGDWPMVRDLYDGYVGGDPRRAAELCEAAVRVYAASTVRWVTADDVEGL